MSSESFEFSDEQNKNIKLLSRIMKYTALVFLSLGIILGIFAGLTIIKYPFAGYTYLVFTVVSITFGVWTNSASYSFRQIVDTEGKDIDILMEAFRMMERVYMLQFIWLLVISLLLLAALVLSAITEYQSVSIILSR